MTQEPRQSAFRGFWREGYESPPYFAEGMEVWLPWGGKALRCKVACAAGFHARVENAARGVSRWVGLLDVAVPSAAVAAQREAMLAARYAPFPHGPKA